MKTVIFGLLATLAVVTTTISFDLTADALAQVTSDNATMAGNVTGGNVTMDTANTTETNSTGSGNISAVGGVL
jgi:hypothetical protein